MFDEKRILTVFFCLVILVCIVFSLSACNLSDLGSQDDSHTHTLVKHEAKSATCTDEGNVEYWHCEKCGKNFSDKDGISEVADVAIPAAGHTYSSEWSKDDDYHWHAATCEHTEEINGKAPHTFDVDNLCTVCGYLKIEATPDSYFAFTLLPDGTYEIKAKDKDHLPQMIRLPSYYNGKPVTSIGDSAFAGCTGLTSITIPYGVTNIGSYAFELCSSLTSITIPDGVTIIGDRAFYECSRLTSVEFGENSKLTRIGSSAFSGCSSLTSITIPASVTIIGESAFFECSSLENITVSKGNTVYHSAGNCLIETASKTLIAGCKTSVIPADGSVTIIWEDAFYGCSSLTSITIPDSVTSIGRRAFYGCSSLTSVTFKNTSGWKVSTSSSFDSYNNISSDDLANTSTAAKYLRDTYCSYYWERS